MKKQILTIGLTILVAGTSAQAFMNNGDNDSCGKRMHKKSFMSHKKDSGLHSVMSIVSDMDLSDSQWLKIRTTMKSMKKDRFKNHDSKKISKIILDKDGNFNKEEFIKNHTLTSSDLIEKRASRIEKILDILDASQKKIVADKLLENRG